MNLSIPDKVIKNLIIHNEANREFGTIQDDKSKQLRLFPYFLAPRKIHEKRAYFRKSHNIDSIGKNWVNYFLEVFINKGITHFTIEYIDAKDQLTKNNLFKHSLRLYKGGQDYSIIPSNREDVESLRFVKKYPIWLPYKDCKRQLIPTRLAVAFSAKGL